MRRSLQRGGGASGAEWRQSRLLSTQDILRWVIRGRGVFGLGLICGDSSINIIFLVIFSVLCPGSNAGVGKSTL